MSWTMSHPEHDRDDWSHSPVLPVRASVAYGMFDHERLGDGSSSPRRDETFDTEDGRSTTWSLSESQTAAKVVTRRKFTPEPLETSKTMHRVHSKEVHSEVVDIEQTPKARRRYKPDLIEECRRAKRASRPGPAMLHIDKTDITPGTNHIYAPRYPRVRELAAMLALNPSNASHPTVTENVPLDPFMANRADSSKHHLNVHTHAWDSSFQPALPAIPSASNTDTSASISTSSPPSLSGTHSLSSSAADTESLSRLYLMRVRRSRDLEPPDSALAAQIKAAEKRLRDQALAAFPNEYHHEIIEHFYTRDEDSDGTRTPPRRQSSGDGWAAREMRLHQAKLDKLRLEAQPPVTVVDPAADGSEHTHSADGSADPFWNASKFAMLSRAAAGQDILDPAEETKRGLERRLRSPPMLGKDLVFPVCPSPQATRFESDQRADLKLSSSATGGGLWGGFCVRDEGAADNHKSNSLGLIQTPKAIEIEIEIDPFICAEPEALPRTPRTPKRERPWSGIQMLAGLDERLAAEAQKSRHEEDLQAEFDDAFVCQVYNYLSLGYPGLARSFDEELSRISGVDVQDIRAGDDHAQGFLEIVSVGDGEGRSGTTSRGVDGREDPVEGMPAAAEDMPTAAAEDMPAAPTDARYGPRWQALRLYIWEWARQHPDTMTPFVSSSSGSGSGSGGADCWFVGSSAGGGIGGRGGGGERSGRRVVAGINNGWGVGTRRDSWGV